MTRILFMSLAGMTLIAACGGGEPPSLEIGPDGLTDAQRAAYDQCLYERQAEAVAIEVIEQGCLKQVTGEDDPLGLKPGE